MANAIGTGIDVRVSGMIRTQSSSKYHLLTIHDIRACLAH